MIRIHRALETYWLDHFRNVVKLSKWLGTEDGAEAVRALWARDDRASCRFHPMMK